MVIINMSKTFQTLKTLTTVHIAEYFQAQGEETICISLDTLHSSFYNYKRLNVINTFINGTSVDFKKLIDFIKINKERHIVIDCGACVFSPLLDYFWDNNIISLFKEQNIDLRFISMIEGGTSTRECIHDFHVLSKIPQIQLICINNERLAKTRIKGKEFFETKAYQYAIENNVITGEINLSHISGFNLKSLFILIKERLTLDEAITGHTDFCFLRRPDLKRIKDQLWDNFEQAFSSDESKKITIKEAKSLIPKDEEPFF